MKILRLFKMHPKEILYKIKFKIAPSMISSNDYRNYLLKKGIEVGEGTFFFDPPNTIIDIQRPWMVKIGKYCKVTSGVKILAHDYSRSVLRRRFGVIIPEAGETIIGDNVFIGMNAILLMGSNIGNNTIIGAGSIVSGKFPDNVVIAGNPARVICTLEDYKNKREKSSISEFEILIKSYFNEYKRYPMINEIGAFFVYCLPKSRKALAENNIYTKWNGDEENEIVESFLNSTSPYINLESFYKNYE